MIKPVLQIHVLVFELQIKFLAVAQAQVILLVFDTPKMVEEVQSTHVCCTMMELLLQSQTNLLEKIRLLMQTHKGSALPFENMVLAYWPQL
jgi:hypothetical protein